MTQLAKGRARRRCGKGTKRKLREVKRNEKRQLWYFTLKRDASVTLQQDTGIGEMKINSAYAPNEVNSKVG